jgi:hypothetical protein
MPWILGATIWRWQYGIYSTSTAGDVIIGTSLNESHKLFVFHISLVDT